MLQAALSGKATAQQPDRVQVSSAWYSMFANGGKSQLLERALYPCATSQVGQATVGFRNEADRYRLTPRHWAYLRVGEGCNHSCTFCAIPGFR